MTLVIKYVRVQRENNQILRRQKKFWIGNFLTAVFFFAVLITIVLIFSRTVALQVGKMAMLNPEKSATKSTLNYFTPNYKKYEDIYNRDCMQTFLDENGDLINFPTLV